MQQQGDLNNLGVYDKETFFLHNYLLYVQKFSLENSLESKKKKTKIKHWI